MQLNRVLRNTIIGGLFLVPLIPLIVVNEWYFPFITGKNFFFRILVEILFALWLILAIRDTRFRPSFSWLVVSIGIFVAIIGLADILGENPFKSFWSNFERMEGFLALAHLFLYFLVLGTVVQTEKLWGWLANTTVGVSIVIGLYGLFQLWGVAERHGSDRVDATLGNATYMAVYMLFHIFITAILLYRWRGGPPAGGWVRYMYGAIIALQTVLLYYTATRGSILGLLGGVFLAALIFAILRWRNHSVRIAAVSIISALIILVGSFIALKNAEFVQSSSVLSRFANISLEEGTVQSRFVIWGMAWEGFKERPVLGWGQENFNYVFNKYYEPELYDQEAWFDRAHNVFFDWLIAGGAPGLLAYLAIAFAALFYLWRRDNPFSDFERAAFTGLLAAYGFHNLFVFDNIVSYIFYFSVLAYIYARTREPVRPGTLIGAHIGGEGTVRIIASFVIIVLLFSLYFFNARGMAVAGTIIEALRTDQANHEEMQDDSLNYFLSAAAHQVTGRQEVREQFTQSAIRVARNQNFSIKLKQAYFDGARTEMEELVAAAPNDARIRLFYGSLFAAYGQQERAAEQFEKAREFSPQKQQILFALGRTYINLQQFDKALEVFRYAFEIEPSYGKARILYATAAIFAGNHALADELLTEGFGTTAVDDSDLLRAYTVMGRYDRVIAILEERLERQPQDLQAYLSLAAVYAEMGQRGRAIEWVRTAIDRFPDFKEQGETFIQQIQRGESFF